METLFIIKIKIRLNFIIFIFLLLIINSCLCIEDQFHNRTFRVISSNNNCMCLRIHTEDDPPLYNFSPCVDGSYKNLNFKIVRSKNNSPGGMDCDNFTYHIKSTPFPSKGIKSMDANFPKKFEEFEIIKSSESGGGGYFIKVKGTSLCLTYTSSLIELGLLFVECDISENNSANLFLFKERNEKFILPSVSILLEVDERPDISKHAHIYLFNTNSENITTRQIIKIVDNSNNYLPSISLSNVETGVHKFYQFGFNDPIEIIDFDYCMKGELTEEYKIHINEKITKENLEKQESFRSPCIKCKTYYKYFHVFSIYSDALVMYETYCPEGSVINGLLFNLINTGIENFFLYKYKCLFSKKISSIATITALKTKTPIKNTSAFPLLNFENLHVTCPTNNAISSYTFRYKKQTDTLEIQGRCNLIYNTTIRKTSHEISTPVIKFNDSYNNLAMTRLEPLDLLNNKGINSFYYYFNGENTTLNFANIYYYFIEFDDEYNEHKELSLVYSYDLGSYANTGPVTQIDLIRFQCPENSVFNSFYIVTNPNDKVHSVLTCIDYEYDSFEAMNLSTHIFNNVNNNDFNSFGKFGYNNNNEYELIRKWDMFRSDAYFIEFIEIPSNFSFDKIIAIRCKKVNDVIYQNHLGLLYLDRFLLFTGPNEAIINFQYFTNSNNVHSYYYCYAFLK